MPDIVALLDAPATALALHQSQEARHADLDRVFMSVHTHSDRARTLNHLCDSSPSLQ